MSISIRSETREKYIYLACEGRYTHEDWLRVYEVALSLAQKDHRPAVLIDARNLEGEPPTVIERFNQSCYLAFLQRSIQVNLLLVGQEPMIDPRRFGETVLLNRGGKGWAFTSLEDAIDLIQRA